MKKESQYEEELAQDKLDVEQIKRLLDISADQKSELGKLQQKQKLKQDRLDHAQLLKLCKIPLSKRTAVQKLEIEKLQQKEKIREAEESIREVETILKAILDRKQFWTEYIKNDEESIKKAQTQLTELEKKELELKKQQLELNPNRKAGERRCRLMETQPPRRGTVRHLDSEICEIWTVEG